MNRNYITDIHISLMELELEGGLESVFGEDVVLILNEFCGTEQEGEEVVVVEAPDPVAAGGVELVEQLDAPHQSDVPVEDSVDEEEVVLGGVEAELLEGQQEEHEVELVAGPVVDALVTAPRVVQVLSQLDLGAFSSLVQQLSPQPLVGERPHPVQPHAERLVPESLSLLAQRSRLQYSLHPVQVHHQSS